MFWDMRHWVRPPLLSVNYQSLWYVFIWSSVLLFEKPNQTKPAIIVTDGVGRLKSTYTPVSLKTECSSWLERASESWGCRSWRAYSQSFWGRFTCQQMNKCVLIDCRKSTHCCRGIVNIYYLKISLPKACIGRRAVRSGPGTSHAPLGLTICPERSGKTPSMSYALELVSALSLEKVPSSSDWEPQPLSGPLGFLLAAS